MTKRPCEYDYGDGLRKKLNRYNKSCNTRPKNTTCNYEQKSKDLKPLCVRNQLYQNKSTLKDFLPDISTKQHFITIIFLFKPTDNIGLELCQQLTFDYGENIKVIGITPFPHEQNNYNFDIISDNNGQISKALGLRDPLGGGIYSISSFLVYDTNGDEIVRFKIDFDKQVGNCIRKVIGYLTGI